MSLPEQFNQLPTCPACHGARELTAFNLCPTCTRLWQAGRLQDYREQLQVSPMVVSTITKGQSMSTPMFQPLFKRAKGGAVQVWQIRVDQEANGSATIVTTYGQVDGKMQELRDTVTKGKNTGKKNETSPFQQAVNEAVAKWTHQRDRKHYGLTVEESATKKDVAPMLAESYFDENGNITTAAEAVVWDPSNTFVQPKFDGYRGNAIATENGVKIVTRKGLELTACEHITRQLQTFMPIGGPPIDGEIYLHGVPVTTIGGYAMKHQPETARLCFMMYDMVDPQRAFVDRFDYLRKLTPDGIPHLHIARTQPVKSMNDVLEFHEQCVANGYEGAMLRHSTAGYEPGVRSGNLLKVKHYTDGEFTIVGCMEGRGKYAGAAVFECVTPAGAKFGVTAPGKMHEKQAYWQNRSDYIGKRLTIKYQKMTETTSPVPFQPVAKAIASE